MELQEFLAEQERRWAHRSFVEWANGIDYGLELAGSMRPGWLFRVLYGRQFDRMIAELRESNRAGSIDQEQNFLR